METPTFEFHVDAAQGQPVVIEMRQGNALPLTPRKKVLIVGDIYAPAEFIRKRFELTGGVDPNAIILVDLEDGKIEIDTMPQQSDLGENVQGKLYPHPDFTALGLNSGTLLRSKDMIALIRKISHCFDNVELARSLIKSLQNQEVKVETLITDIDDRKGSVEKKLKQDLKVLKGELPSSLALTVPFFEHCPAKHISVEIEIDVSGSAVLYSLYCLGIEQMVLDETMAIVEGQITPEIRSKFVVITK